MPEPSSSIRLATTSDAAAIADIHRAARAEAMPWLPVLHTPAEDLSFFRQNVLPEETVLVAEADGRICGFVAFQKDWLNHLYIATEYWRAGQGTALLHRVQTASTRLQLWTFQDNHRARAFYAKHGFVEVERTDGAGNEEKTPDVRLVWETGSIG